VVVVVLVDYCGAVLVVAALIAGRVQGHPFVTGKSEILTAVRKHS
jgi:hypothetical protein